MNTRQGEPHKLRFRSERFFRTTEGWFFQTREGFNSGPYPLLQQARTEADRLIERLKATPVAEVSPRLPKTIAWMVQAVPQSSGILCMAR